jgi:outer membrane lipoprotein SlyB
VYGNTRAPHSREKKEQLRDRNTAIGAMGGAAVGASIAGPPGALVGAVLGGVAGRHKKVPT